MELIAYFSTWIAGYSFSKFFESVIIPFGFNKLADNILKNKDEIDKEFGSLLEDTCKEFQNKDIDAFGGNIKDYLRDNDIVYNAIMQLIWNFEKK